MLILSGCRKEFLTSRGCTSHVPMLSICSYCFSKLLTARCAWSSFNLCPIASKGSRTSSSAGVFKVDPKGESSIVESVRPEPEKRSIVAVGSCKARFNILNVVS